MNKQEFLLRKQLVIELGKYVLDLTKLVFAGIVVTGIFSSQIEKSYLVIIGAITVVIGTLMGFSIIYFGNKLKK